MRENERYFHVYWSKFYYNCLLLKSVVKQVWNYNSFSLFCILYCGCFYTKLPALKHLI